MTTRKTAPTSVVYTLGQGGPSLLNLRVDRSKVIVLVNGPGMLFDHLEVLTTLGAAEGVTADAWQAFVKGIEVTAHCGASGKVKIAPELKTSRVGFRIWIGVGATGMYQNELHIQAKKKGDTLKSLLDRCFAQKDSAKYLAMLCPALSTGHAEHQLHTTVLGGDHQHDHEQHMHAHN